MNQEQYEAARGVITADCEITGKLMDEQGRTCAIGGLAKAAGVEDRYLVYRGASYEADKAIKEVFDIDPALRSKLMHANDRRPILRYLRRRKVVKVLDKHAKAVGLKSKKFLGIF